MNSLALFALGAGIGLVITVVIVVAYVGAAAQRMDEDRE